MTRMPVQRYIGEHCAILDSFRSFVTRELVPLAAETCGEDDVTATAEVRQHVRRRSAALGFYAGDYPERVGGQGMPFAAKVLLHEYAEASGCPLASVALSGAEGPSALLLMATADQQERYLRPLVTARATRCLALTEPGGGSDSFDLATTASRRAGKWILSGRKTFVSHADEADFALVYASAAIDEAPARSVAFIVPMDTSGIDVGQRYQGMSGEPLFEVVLDEVELGDDALLGGLEAIHGHTWNGLASLARGRLVVAASCNGMAARALALGVEFSQTKRSFGRRICEYQHVQEHLVTSRVALESSRLLTFAAAQDLDDGADVFAMAAMAKLQAADGACATVDRMVQVHGATAWIKGHPLERLYRAVRAMPIIEGTSEIQKVIIAHAMGLG